MASARFKTVDEYFSSLSPKMAIQLEVMRDLIRSAAPAAEEVISYNMPAFRLNGMLVWYAANKEHIGLYPTGSGVSAFKEKLVKFKTSKGAIQFPLDKQLPKTLIKEIVRFRVKENQARAALKKKAGAKSI